MSNQVYFEAKREQKEQAFETYMNELVERDKPMKPIHLGGNKYSCKNCSMAFELKSKIRFVNKQYCDVCGQKLDWSEE